MRNQKVAHTIRSQGQAAECAEKPPNHANVAGKFLTHTEVEHAQGPGFTNLYPANTEGGGS